MASSIADAVEVLDTLAYNHNLVRFCQLGGTFVALYDHAITFDQEVELIWKKRWSFLKVLFIVNRYIGTLVLIGNAVAFLRTGSSEKFCFYWFRVQGFSNALIVWLMQVILQFRVYAMYKKSKLVLAFLLFCFAGEIASTSAILISTYMTTGVLNEPLPGVFMCIASKLPSYFSAFWIPVIVFETILFAFALWVGVRHYRELRQSSKSRGKDVVSILLRDSILYFLITLTTYTACAVVWLALPPIWLEVPEGFALGATCIMGSRLVLNLRDAYYKPDVTGGDYVLPVDSFSPGPTQRPNTWTRKSRQTDSRRHGADGIESVPLSPIPGRQTQHNFWPPSPPVSLYTSDTGSR